MSGDPNFPKNLDIRPHHVPDNSFYSTEFNEDSQTESIKIYGIAGRVWEAAYAMTTYIESPPPLQFDPPFFKQDNDPTNFPIILELGSGTGIVASCIAKSIRCSLIVTDLPEVCPLLDKNLRKFAAAGNPASVIVRPLSWGNEAHALDILREMDITTDTALPSGRPRFLTHVVCSDLVYFPELLAPLLRTLLQITSPPFACPHSPSSFPKVVISYKIRSLAKETLFWSAFGLWFSFSPVLVKHREVTQDTCQAKDDTSMAWSRFGASEDEDVFIFVASRRPDSFTWTVPPDDQDLLTGVGARGTSSRKDDGTFEELLLMQLEV